MKPDDRLLEACLQLGVGDAAVVGERRVRLREREHVRVDARAEVLQRHAQRPQAAVAADHRRRSGHQQPVLLVERLRAEPRDPVDHVLERPGIDALYSGEQITNAARLAVVGVAATRDWAGDR